MFYGVNSPLNYNLISNDGCVIQLTQKYHVVKWSTCPCMCFQPFFSVVNF